MHWRRRRRSTLNRMERHHTCSICSLAYGSLPEAGATVDTHLLTQCRPHYKSPSAILPVANYVLPLPQNGTHLGPFRGVCDVLFTPYSPSLLLACTSEGTVLTFDMNHGAFVSETRVAGEPGAVPNRKRYAACVHVNRDPTTPLFFSGSPNGDVMVFDWRISGLSSKLLGRKFCPTLRLPSAHNGAVCGIGTGVALHPHLFLTGGREDRWIRVFDIRFPFHYSSGGSSSGSPTPYPLEARRLGPSEQGGDSQTVFMAFDVSPDGSLMAASIARYHVSAHLGTRKVLGGADGETILISLPDGMRAIKTIASADGCAADFLQFSPNAKYILQTGGVRAGHCKLCWQCLCRCSCGSSLRQRHLNAQTMGCIDTDRRTFALRECNGDSLTEPRGEYEFCNEDAIQGDRPMPCQPPHGWRCSYHRAQLLNLVQANRAVNLKSPADGAVAFTDSFCLSHSVKELHKPNADVLLDPHREEEVSVRCCLPSPPPVPEHNSSLLRTLHFTLYGPQSSYGQSCRERFWGHLLTMQSSRASAARTKCDSVKEALQRADNAMQQQAIRPQQRSQFSVDRSEYTGKETLPTATLGGAYSPVTAVRETRGATVNDERAPAKPLLFPLLHPQLSHFTASCGPLHPAFVRAEAATWPFTCRLWGGLVVGYGGSTADRCGCHRLYDGLKLWDSTTGVVLSWAEGELASEDNLRCIAPVPDVSTSLLVTGGYVPSDIGRTQHSAQSAGLTFWSLRRRDDLLISALEGSFSLEVQINDDSLERSGGD